MAWGGCVRTDISRGSQGPPGIKWSTYRHSSYTRTLSGGYNPPVTRVERLRRSAPALRRDAPHPAPPKLRTERGHAPPAGGKSGEATPHEYPRVLATLGTRHSKEESADRYSTHPTRVLATLGHAGGDTPHHRTRPQCRGHITRKRQEWRSHSTRVTEGLQPSDSHKKAESADRYSTHPPRVPATLGHGKRGHATHTPATTAVQRTHHPQEARVAEPLHRSNRGFVTLG